MNCSTEPIDKKEFGISVYKKLHNLHGMKNHYDVSEIKDVVKVLGYPISWECWALVAFMMPANVGEYLRSNGTPMDVLEMKREIIRAMTDGKRDSLNLPSEFKGNYDVQTSELTQMNLVNFVAMYSGYKIGSDFVTDMAGL